MIFTFSVVKSVYFFLKSSVSTSFFDDRLHSEFTIHMDASSREWRRWLIATCSGRWISERLHRIWKNIPWKHLRSLLEYKWWTNYTPNIDTSSGEWRNRQPTATHTCRSMSKQFYRRYKIITTTQTMMILYIQRCV